MFKKLGPAEIASVEGDFTVKIRLSHLHYTENGKIFEVDVDYDGDGNMMLYKSGGISIGGSLVTDREEYDRIIKNVAESLDCLVQKTIQV